MCMKLDTLLAQHRGFFSQYLYNLEEDFVCILSMWGFFNALGFCLSKVSRKLFVMYDLKKKIWRFCQSKSRWQRELSPDISHLLKRAKLYSHSFLATPINHILNHILGEVRD